MSNGNDHAYPVATVDGYTQYGLAKRELFAAMAMQGMTEGLKWDGEYSRMDRDAGLPARHAQWVAAAAVRYADALLAELAKGEE